MSTDRTPLDRLRDHVTGAIERGEAVPIVEVPTADAVNERARRLTAEVNAEDTETVLAAVKGRAPAEVRQTAEFDIEPTRVHKFSNVGEFILATRIRVSATRYRHDDEEDDGQGYIRVEAYGRPAKKDGGPDMRTDPYWYPLPYTLAAPLLLQALTHTR